MAAIRILRVIDLPYVVIRPTAVSEIFRCDGTALYDADVDAEYYQSECTITLQASEYFTYGNRPYSIIIRDSIMRLSGINVQIASVQIPQVNRWLHAVYIANYTHNGSATLLRGICTGHIIDIVIDWYAAYR